ncbi:hypothetical protein AVEN_3767-1 [Araneus ventricosus]|uniref:Uncharacterized protein n=1 Tax=Araneus ventricosus TaxID=182803 RepID=A0A4Y2NNI0_ARAVE|nr:hypothetical protein AVEN_3767-1 [Araneus ventricosus]
MRTRVGFSNIQRKIILPACQRPATAQNKVVAEDPSEQDHRLHLAWSGRLRDPKKEDQEPIFRSKSFGAQDPS